MGVDVSAHNEPVDLAALAGSGARFAMVKATEGTTYLNPFFGKQVRGAEAAGLVVGQYAFARPDSNDPRAQADAFADHAGYRPGPHTLTPMVDLEYGAIVHQPECYRLSPKQMVAWIRAYVTRATHRFGTRPMIYTTADWWRTCTGGSTRFSAYPLVAASDRTDRPQLPPGWTRWTMWQYTDHAALAGSTEPIDGDVRRSPALPGPP